MPRKKTQKRARRKQTLHRGRRGAVAKRSARSGQRRARVQRPRTVAATAVDVATGLRQAIARFATRLTRRLKKNGAGFSEAAITEAMGANAAKLTAFLADAATIGQKPTPAQPPAQ